MTMMMKTTMCEGEWHPNPCLRWMRKRTRKSRKIGPSALSWPAQRWYLWFLCAFRLMLPVALGISFVLLILVPSSVYLSWPVLPLAPAAAQASHPYTCARSPRESCLHPHQRNQHAQESTSDQDDADGSCLHCLRHEMHVKRQTDRLPLLSSLPEPCSWLHMTTKASATWSEYPGCWSEGMNGQELTEHQLPRQQNRPGCRHCICPYRKHLAYRSQPVCLDVVR